jgi:DNA-binding MarR family transcriptional regulator
MQAFFIEKGKGVRSWGLNRIAKGGMNKHGKTVRHRVICEAVRAHGYRQSEVAGYLGIHYSTISKIVAGDR